jgi:hypothetical protein
MLAVKLHNKQSYIERICCKICQCIKDTQDWDFFGVDFEICNISLLVMSKYSDGKKNLIGPVLEEVRFFCVVLRLR